MARKRKSRRRSTARRHRGRRRNPGLTPAAFMNPRRHRRKGSYRRRSFNPVRMGGGIVKKLTRGAMRAVGIVAGKVASRAIPSLVGLNQTGMAGVAIQAAAAMAAGWAASKVNADFGEMVLVGGLAGIIEGYAKAANIPVVSATLGDEYSPVGAYLPAGDQSVNMGLYQGEGPGESSGVGEDLTDSIGLLPG